MVCALSSCARYAPAPIDSGRRADRLLGARLSARSWTLRDLEAEAVRRSSEVAQARAQYETARAAIRTAGESPNPTLAASPQIVTPWAGLIPGTYGVDIDWQFETAGKRSRRIDLAHENARAAAAHVVDAIWKARSTARTAFVDLAAAQQRVKLLTEVTTQQDQLLHVFDERIAAGEESRIIQAQPRLLQAQYHVQQADAVKSETLARAALAQSLELSVAGLARANFVFPDLARAPRNVAIRRRDALTRRADVLAALANYAAAEATLHLEIAKQYPDIHLGPGYTLDQGQNKWVLGLTATLPILNHNQGAIGEALSKRTEAAAAFDVVQAKALGECDHAAALLAAARAKLATADALLAEQDRQVASEQRMLTEGAGDRTSLLSAQTERSLTLVARLDALADWQTALGAVEAATQTPIAP